MDRRAQLTRYLLFYFLVIFPFGQLFRINLSQLGFTIQPIDLVSIISLFLLTKADFKSKTFLTLIAILGFSLLFSLNLFNSLELLPGLLYLLRFIGYLAFYLKLKKLFQKEYKKELIINSLITVLLITTLFGWIQYIFLPDFRSFKILGWDDHLFRLIGTFFDPGFIGIILVLGFIFAFGLYLKTTTKGLLLASIVFALTIAFTYSRASYLALFVSLSVLTFLTRKAKLLLIFIPLFLILIYILPRPSGLGVQLERTFSIELRFSNYEEGFGIFSKSPLLGIGYNNLCVYKLNYLRISSFNSHACSGLDSSIIFVLATTGLVGFIILGNLCYQVIKTLSLNNHWHRILLSSLIAVGIHSQFVNSLFYPWVLGYLAILSAWVMRRN